MNVSLKGLVLSAAPVVLIGGVLEVAVAGDTPENGGGVGLVTLGPPQTQPQTAPAPVVPQNPINEGGVFIVAGRRG